MMGSEYQRILLRSEKLRATILAAVFGAGLTLITIRVMLAVPGDEGRWALIVSALPALGLFGRLMIYELGMR